MGPTIITFAPATFDQIREHLLPPNGVCEEAAFLFTRSDGSSSETSLPVIDFMLIPPEGFASRSRFYLELTDDTRAKVIKHAHNLDAGLIECHSHPSQRGACFSWSDLHGFDEFVPHVQWRLPGRAYSAIVFASDSIDALVWVGAGTAAVPVDAVFADDRVIKPTRFTLTNWGTIYDSKPV